MEASRRAALVALAAGALAGCGRAGTVVSGGHIASATSGGRTTAAPAPTAAATRAPRTVPAAAPALTRTEVVARYGHLRPHSWGFGGPGVVRELGTSRRVIALTFDACGGYGGSGYDQALISFLRRREVPATLFLNSRWIDANPAAFGRLAAEPLFEIANHGTR